MSTPQIIELHAGHWKNEGSGANGLLNEVKEARRVVARVQAILKGNNVPVSVLNDDVSTNQRDNINYLVKQHNKTSNGLVVSVHFNASGGTHKKAIGTEVLYKTDKQLATRVVDAISEATGGGLLNRGAKYRDDIGVLNKTKEPAILIEVCFVNSETDQAVYRRDFEKISQAIAKQLAAAIGHEGKVKAEEEDLVLTQTSRDAMRKVLKKARDKGIISTAVHTDKAINGYDDKALQNYHLVVLSQLALKAIG